MNLDGKRVKPVNGTLYIRDEAKEEKTKGGIILADNVEGDRMHVGEVLSTSPFLVEDGRYKDPPVVAGDQVMYGQHAGAGCVWTNDTEKRTYRMIKWNEVLAVISDEKS